MKLLPSQKLSNLPEFCIWSVYVKNARVLWMILIPFLIIMIRLCHSVGEGSSWWKASPTYTAVLHIFVVSCSHQKGQLCSFGISDFFHVQNLSWRGWCAIRISVHIPTILAKYIQCNSVVFAVTT